MQFDEFFRIRRTVWKVDSNWAFLISKLQLEPDFSLKSLFNLQTVVSCVYLIILSLSGNRLISALFPNTYSNCPTSQSVNFFHGLNFSEKWAEWEPGEYSRQHFFKHSQNFVPREGHDDHLQPARHLHVGADRRRLPALARPHCLPQRRRRAENEILRALWPQFKNTLQLYTPLKTFNMRISRTTVGIEPKFYRCT